MMKKLDGRLLGTFLVSALAANCAVGSAAVLDQAQESHDSISSMYVGQRVAQTFRPGFSAQLDHVDLYAEWPGPAQYSLEVLIVETIGELPTGTVLASVSVPGNEDLWFSWFSVDFLSESVFLSAGELYAIVMQCSNPDVNGSLGLTEKQGGDAYPGGKAWTWLSEWNEWRLRDSFFGEVGDADRTFRTYMVPEPATLSLLALGGLAMIRRRRRMA
jgi:hypothetical protein